ncbi:unnamed protein product [Paramecium sonneborni]|uniref:Uncharacterized protein n=1 Tax=Paramecium sonneborni TaxID=65129 RepID=A0A8S1PGS0_9CILI|nr:unnamed protein product [Paramecium sonneborni]
MEFNNLFYTQYDNEYTYLTKLLPDLLKYMKFIDQWLHLIFKLFSSPYTQEILIPFIQMIITSRHYYYNFNVDISQQIFQLLNQHLEQKNQIIVNINFSINYKQFLLKILINKIQIFVFGEEIRYQFDITSCCVLRIHLKKHIVKPLQHEQDFYSQIQSIFFMKGQVK